MSDDAVVLQNEQNEKIHELVKLICQKICIEQQVHNKQLTGRLVDGVTRLSMRNGASTTFKEFESDLAKTLNDELLADSSIDVGIYNNFLKFVNKMVVAFVIDLPNEPYCMIELHDTIGKYTPSESTGSRCNALRYFHNVIQWIVGYINDDRSRNTSDKKFNYPAKIKLGSSFVKSLGSCNNASLTTTGGSKSRRTHRRKHNRKTQRKHARKTHHNRGGRRGRSYTKRARKMKSHKRRK